LTVTDDDGATDTDIVAVSVNPASLNEAPVANAGGDVTLQLPDNFVVINGSASDDDGTPTILWEKVSGPAATLGATNVNTLSLSNLVAGTYVFKITATDAGTLSDTDEVTVTVFPEIVVPGDPIVNAGEDVQIRLPQNEVAIPAVAEADEGSLIVSYSWTQISGPPVLFERADSVVAVIKNLTPGEYSFTVMVTDASGKTATDEVTLTVFEETVLVKPSELFSPDNNDINQAWMITNANLLDDCDIIVYNRQGQKVYASHGYPIPWDGTSNGSAVPDGAYFYVITCAGKTTQTGSVTIARLK
jgi:gliding motility-associated-like protein